jgi:hypothetical protein
VPFGQPNAGEIKPSKEVADFEQVLNKLEAKVHAKEKPATEPAPKNTSTQEQAKPAKPTTK